MKYFSQFPTITTSDGNGNEVNVVNIMVRTEIIPSLLNNALLFYEYDIQDGDTPDIIATKYYNDPDRFWISMYSSQLFDAQGDWPMSSQLFADYLVDKYDALSIDQLTGDLLTSSGYSDLLYESENPVDLSANVDVIISPATASQILAYTQSTVYQYIKTVTTTDSSTATSNTITYIIDADEYANTTQGTQTVQFNTGAFSTITTTAYPQYIYDYENELNESKRTLNLLNVNYAGQIENQLTSILG